MTLDPDTQRNGDWIQTYTGRAFHYADFRPSDFCIEDIAHALSMECRYGGHTAWHYSVAQHSCHIYDALMDEEEMVRKQALMHDAPEAYIKDLPRPFKAYVGPEYKAINDDIWRAICIKYYIDEIMEPIVKEIDLRVALDEKACLLSKSEKEWTGISASFKKLGLQIPEWSPARAKAEFLMRFRQEFGVYTQ